MSDIALYEQVVQEIELQPVQSQADADRLQNLLTVRRQLIERLYSIRELQGLRQRRLGELQAVRDKLKAGQGSNGQAISEPQRLELEGRGMMAESKVAYCQAMIEQHYMELEMYRRMLKEEE